MERGARLSGRAPRCVYARSSLKPAAAKSPSKARASVMRSLLMSAKLVASTNE